MQTKFLAIAVVLPLVVAGCATASQKPVAAPTTTPSTPATPPPPDLSPNTLRDRRAEPGVRAAAQPLVLDNARSVKCGRLAKGGAGDEADLLGGRLTVRAPRGAKPPPSRGDAAPPEEESRLVVDGRDKISLAVVAKETFQLDPDLYEPEADAPSRPGHLDVEAPKFLKAAFPNEEGLEITPVELGDAKLRAYAARPPEPSAAPGKDTALVLALLLAQDDGTLESIAFYVRGESVRNATGPDLVGCTRLAERVASSVAPGARKLERAAGPRRLADVSSSTSLAVTVPADYVAIRSSAGARVTKLRPLSLYPGSISVSIASAAPKIPDGADATASGTLLGHPVEWRGKTSARGGFFFAAPVLDVGDGNAKEKKTAEILVKATRQQKALDEMRAVAETLAIVKK